MPACVCVCVRVCVCVCARAPFTWYEVNVSATFIFHHSGEKLYDFVIEAKLSRNSPASVCEEITTALKTNETRHVGCRLGSVGRFVRIRLSGTKRRTLTLCEVEVYGGMHINLCQTVILTFFHNARLDLQHVFCFWTTVGLPGISFWFNFICLIINITHITSLNILDIAVT